MRRILLYTDHGLMLSEWAGRRLRAVKQLQGDADPADWVRQLSRCASDPIDLVIDSAMEAFRVETLPRLSRRDLRAAGLSLLRKHYRDYNLRQCVPLKTPDSPRLRLAGVAGDRKLYELIDSLVAAGVRVRHIFSAPALAAALIENRTPPEKSLVLLTRHGEDGWRHSLYRDGRLIISRVAAVSNSSLADEHHLANSTAETLGYLESRGLIEDPEQVQVALIDPGELHGKLADGFQLQSLPSPLVLDPGRLLDAIATVPPAHSRYTADLYSGLLLSALALQRPVSDACYRLDSLQQTNRRHLLRGSLWLASAACALATLVMITGYWQRLTTLAAETIWLQERLVSATRAFGELPASADALEGRAMDLESRIAAAGELLNAPAPDATLPLPALARILTPRRQIEIDRLSWSRNTEWHPMHKAVVQAQAAREVDSRAVTVRMTGRVRHSPGSLQEIDAGFREFLAASRQLPGLQQTRVLRAPLQSFQSSGVAGPAGRNSTWPADLAGFEVEWILEVRPHESS